MSLEGVLLLVGLLVLLMVGMFFVTARSEQRKKVKMALADKAVDGQIEQARKNLIAMGKDEEMVNYMFFSLWPDRYQHLTEHFINKPEEPDGRVSA